MPFIAIDHANRKRYNHALISQNAEKRHGSWSINLVSGHDRAENRPEEPADTGPGRHGRYAEHQAARSEFRPVGRQWRRSYGQHQGLIQAVPVRARSPRQDRSHFARNAVSSI